MIKPPWISTGRQRWPTHVLFTGIQEILCDGHHQLRPWLWPETFSRCLQWPGLLPAVAHRPFLTGQYYASVPYRRGAGSDPRGFRPCRPSRSAIKTLQTVSLSLLCSTQGGCSSVARCSVLTSALFLEQCHRGL